MQMHTHAAVTACAQLQLPCHMTDFQISSQHNNVMKSSQRFVRPVPHQTWPQELKSGISTPTDGTGNFGPSYRFMTVYFADTTPQILPMSQ